MAEWIKVEKHTPTKSEMRQIAKLCNCSLDVAFASFFRFYSWADGETEDGIIYHITTNDADEIAKLLGFGIAAQTVGWMSFQDNGVIIHRFDRHNGDSAKKRCTEAEKKRQQRKLRPESVPSNRGHLSPQNRDICPESVPQN